MKDADKNSIWKVFLTISFRALKNLWIAGREKQTFLVLPAMPCSSQTLPGDGGSNQRQNPVARPRQLLIVLWTFPASNLMLMKTISSFQKHKPKQKLTSPCGSRMFVPFQLSNPPSYGLIVKYFPSSYLSVPGSKVRKDSGLPLGWWEGVSRGSTPPATTQISAPGSRAGGKDAAVNNRFCESDFPKTCSTQILGQKQYSAVLRSQTQVW